MKKRQKTEKGRARRRKGAQPRSAATTPEDKALQESEAEFRSLVESAAVPICITDLTGEITYVNKALADLGGYTVQELVGHPFMDFLRPEDREVALSIFTEAVSTSEEVSELKFRVTRRDGQILALTSKPTRLEIAGKIVGFQAIITDITERERMERELRQNEERYRLIAENMAASVWLMDMNLKPTYISPNTPRARGYTLEELAALPLDRQLTPDSLRLALETFQEALSEENLRNMDQLTRTLELEFYRRDGSTLWSENTFTLIRNAKGEPSGILGVGQDITERKRMEEKLRFSEERYRNLVENSKDSIVILDLKGNVVFGNKASEELTGYSVEEGVGMNVRDITPLRYWPRSLEMLLKARTGRPISHFESFIKRKDGRLVPVESSGQAILQDGKVVGIQVITKDITERKRMEEAYRTVVEHGLQGIVILQDNHVVFANQALLEMTGHSREKMLSFSPNDVKALVHPEDRERVWQDLQNRIVGKPAPTRQVFRFTHKDGAIRWVEALPSRVDYRGKPAVQVAYADITERKRTEEALRENEKRFRHISSVISDIAYSCSKWPDRAYSVDWIMGAVEHITGYSVEEIKAQGCWRFLVVDEDRALFDERVTGLAPGSAGFCELRLRNRSGDTVWVESSAECVTETETPERLRLYGGLVDITERKRADEILRESEERYRKLFEAGVDGIALADADTGILLDCNQALAALVGRNRAELIGQHQTILHPPSKDDSELSPTFRLHATTHEGQVLETQVITATGEIRDVEIKAILLSLQGRSMLQGIFSDITERKRAEDATRRRAEELAALQATVLDITSHQDLEVLLETIVERATRLLRVSSGGMYLCDPQKREARCVVAYRTPYDIKETVLKYGEGVAGTIAETGKPLIVDDYRTWKGRADAYEQTKPFIAVLGVPVIWQGQVTGVIDVLDDRPQHFTKAEQELLTLFANHAAIAIENARLLEQEKQHAEELVRYSTSLEQLVLERTGKLAESERRFRELADLLPQIVFEIDDKGNLLFANRITFAATGYTEDDLRSGLSAFQMVAPEDHDRLRQNMARSLIGEELGANEYAIRRKDGSTFLAIVNTAPIMRGKKPVGLRGVVVDITERKRMEVELRSAKERLDHVITSNPAAIFTAKPRADHSDYNIAYMSESVISMLGFEPRQFIGHPEFWHARIHPDDLRRYPIEIPELWKKGQHTFEYRFLHKDGDYRWIREEARVVCDADGVPTEVIGYWTDITERKRMEEELAKSQRLATIGETAAMVGHDLRNPLQAIVSTAYLAKKSLESLPEPSAELAVKSGLADMLETIENESEYMDKIVYDLQDYSAPLKPELTQVEVESFVKETLSKMRIPQNVKVALKVNKAFPRVMIDPSIMRRILTNLTLNAIQAMPEGGELGIETTGRDEDLFIAFRDTGVGIAEENMDKLFNPFFTTKAKGQGLGLAVCKRLVEAHGGRIIVDSKLGEGSTFTVKLPLVKS